MPTKSIESNDLFVVINGNKYKKIEPIKEITDNTENSEMVETFSMTDK